MGEEKHYYRGSKLFVQEMAIKQFDKVNHET
jgi:hypothetical protein